MNKKQGYEIDFTNRKIIATKSFLKKAGQIGSEEYRILMKLYQDFGTLTVEEKKITKNAKKTTYKNLTYDLMREHLVVRFGEDSEEVERFDYLRVYYKVFNAGCYGKVKAWYLETCKDEYEKNTDDEPQQEEKSQPAEKPQQKETSHPEGNVLALAAMN